MAIPASQNKAERAFSDAGHTMIDLRLNLDSDHHLEDLLVVRLYSKLYFQVQSFVGKHLVNTVE